MINIEGCPCEEECLRWGGCLQTHEEFEIAGRRVYCPDGLRRRAKLAQWIKTNADILHKKRDNPNSGERKVV